ncbi:MAG TPA: tetratricopeptide repeat protein [Fimbriimonas sp.]|nr:tetratricopeptide repeat protein [Fimbriimonas sp.]
MRTVALLAVFASLSGAALAQSGSRVAEIWSAANDRILTQQDIWFNDGDFPADIQLLRVEAEKWPADYDVWTNLGWMEENVEDWDGALATYVRYRRQNPNDPDAALPEADYYNRKRLYAKIPALLEPAIKHKCHPNNFRVLAHAYENQKMYSDAVRVWKTYLQRDPNDGAAKRNLARCEKKLSGGA